MLLPKNEFLKNITTPLQALVPGLVARFLLALATETGVGLSVSTWQLASCPSLCQRLLNYCTVLYVIPSDSVVEGKYWETSLRANVVGAFVWS